MTRRFIRNPFGLISLMLAGTVGIALLIGAQGAIGGDQGPNEVSDVFVAFDREFSEVDALPEEPEDYRGFTSDISPQSVRILGETPEASHYIYKSGDDTVCLLRFPHSNSPQDGVMSESCGPLSEVAEHGLSTGGRMQSGPHYRSYAIPQGYDYVTNEAGEVIGEIEEQLFTIEFENAEHEPQELTASGPAGDLNLTTGIAGGVR